MKTKQNSKLFNKQLLAQALRDSFKKLNPKLLIKNPVIFIVALGAFISTIIVIREAFLDDFSFFNLNITVWLWFTVLFANFSEAIAEGRGKAQAESLEKKQDTNKGQEISR